MRLFLISKIVAIDVKKRYYREKEIF